MVKQKLTALFPAFVLWFTIGAASPSAQASVAFSNGTPDGVGRAVACANCQDTGVIVYDNLVVGAGGLTVNGIFGYFEFGAEDPFLSVGIFEIRSTLDLHDPNAFEIYENAMITASIVSSNPGSVVYRIQADFASVTLNPGEYWIALSPFVSDPSYLLSASGTNGVNAHLDGQSFTAGPSWVGMPAVSDVYGANLDFSYGLLSPSPASDVPEPGTWILAGAALLLIAFRRGGLQVLLAAAVLSPIAGFAIDRPQTLAEAVERGDMPAVREMLEAGADANSKDRAGNPVLMTAVLFTGTDCVKLLLDHGARPDATNAAGATALVWAAGDPAKAVLLLRHGANPKATSALGRTALHTAAAVDGSGATVEALLNGGADPAAKDKLKGFPSIFSGGGGAPAIVEAAKARDGVALRRMLAAKVDVNGADSNGGTALSEAVVLEHVENVRLLLAAGANVEVAIGYSKVRPLMLAGSRGNAEMVEMLLAAGADVRATDRNGNTALHWAAYGAENGDTTVIRAMIAAGADLSQRNAAGETAGAWAARHGRTFAQALLNAEPSADEVRKAIRNAIPALEKAGQVSAQKTGCISCHHNTMPMTAFSIAETRGYAVDAKAMEANMAALLKMIEPATEVLAEGSDVVPQTPNSGGNILMALAARKFPANHMTAALVHNIGLRQRTDGGYNGWAIRPPMSGGDIRETAIAVRGMDLYAPAGRRAEFDARIAKARGWLLAAKPATTEEAIARLMGLVWSHAGREQLEPVVKQVLTMQQSDGGWRQTEGLATDAFATAEAMVALHQSGLVAPDSPAYVKAMRYLLNAQTADGSWHVKTRAQAFQPLIDTGYPHGRDQWISAASTSYALMALLASPLASN